MMPGGKATAGAARGGSLSGAAERKLRSASRPTMFCPRSGISDRGSALNCGAASWQGPPRRGARTRRQAGLPIGRPEHAVDDQLLIGQPLTAQLGAGARCFHEGHAVGPRDEHDRGRGRIGKRPHRGFVSLARCLQAGKRPQTRNIAGRRFQKAGPGGGKLEQAQRMAGRRRIEDHMIVGRRPARDRSTAARTRRRRRLRPCRRPRGAPVAARLPAPATRRDRGQRSARGNRAPPAPG